MSLYRPNCQNGRPRPWPLSRRCFQQKQKGDKVQKYYNVTALPNPTCPDDWDPSFTPPTWPPIVAPYFRPNCAEPANEPGRNQFPGDTAYCDPGHDTGIPCGPWLRSQLLPCLGGPLQIDFNCYSIVPGQYIDYGQCWKMGFKNVQARHWWHGRFGFTDDDGADCPSSPGGCSATIAPSPSGTRYRTIQVSSKYNRTDTGTPANNFDFDLEATFTVDRYSGLIVQTGQSFTQGGLLVGDSESISLVFANADSFLSLFCAQQHAAGVPVVDGITGGWVYDYTCAAGDPGAPFGCTETITGDTSRYVGTFDLSNIHVHRTQSQTFTSGSNSQTTTIEIEAFLSDPVTAYDFVLDVVALLAMWDMADDHTYPWRLDSFTTVAPIVQYNSVPEAQQPQCGGPYTPPGGGDSIDKLSAGWIDPNTPLYDGSIIGKPLPNPGSIKITQDAGTAVQAYGPTVTTGQTIAPGATLQLPNQHVTVTSITKMDSGVTLIYTAIEGKDYTVNPLTGLVTILQGSYPSDDLNLIIDNLDSTETIVIAYSFAQELGGHFDYTHITTHYGDPAGVGSNSPYTFGYGAWSASGLPLDPTDYYMPRCATRWTDNAGAQNLMHGAWQVYSTGQLWMQKWAEVKVPRPSQNYFGPCGPQRYEVDHNKMSCVTDVSGSPPLVTVADSTTLTEGDTVVYWTGTAGTLHTITSISGSDIQLSSAIADLPSAISYQGGPMLGTLRFPDAWSICGRCAVKSIVDNGDGTLTITLTDPAPCLRTGDTLDFTTGTSCPEVIAYSSQTVLSVTSPTQFTISGTGTMPGADFAKSTGAPGFWYYDIVPKGDYIFAKWGFNNRDIAIDTSLRANQSTHRMPQGVNAFEAITDCIPFDPCNPQVMCISPNFNPLSEYSVDSFPNGNTHGFDLIIPDERFGAQWQAVIQQVMDDIFWATPPKPCPTGDDDDFGDTSACAWDEDDGTCQPPQDTCVGVGDTGAMYYPHRPQVEARAALPIPWLDGDTAPTLPTGIYIGYLDLADLDTTGDVSGQILTPPTPVGAFSGDPLYQPNTTGPAWAPWNLYFFEQQCVCQNGRWATQYKQDGAIC